MHVSNSRHPTIADLASCYLADEITAEEFCGEFERWWRNGRDPRTQSTLVAAAAGDLFEVVAWHAAPDPRGGTCGRPGDDQELRRAVMRFLERLTGRADTAAGGNLR